MAESGDFIVTTTRAKAIRDIIENDVVALRDWNTVKDWFVGSKDGLEIKGLLDQHDYPGAILRTLEIWSGKEGKGATMSACILILKSHGLNALAGKLKDNEDKIRNASGTEMYNRMIATEWDGHRIDDFTITTASVREISDVIIQDTTAMRSWGSVKDTLIDDEAKNFIIDKKLKNPDKIVETIQYTLQEWSQTGKNATFFVLLEALRKNHLNALIGNLKDDAMEFKDRESAAKALEDAGGSQSVRNQQNPRVAVDEAQKVVKMEVYKD